MTQIELFYRFGAALLIGLLIGFEREYAKGEPGEGLFAGSRTFALFALSGCIAALAADTLHEPLVFAGIVMLLGLWFIVTYYVSAIKGHVGLTTETSAFITILIVALCYWGFLPLATALGVVTTVLLSLKLEMHRLAERLTKEDVYATLKFAILAAIILPVLPNQSFGPPPFDVLNPFKIGLMVVFISGISFLGYVLVKVVG